MSSNLGSSGCRLGIFRLGQGADQAPLPPRSWATDQRADARIMAAAFARRNRTWLIAVGSRGDIERPDAIDQLPIVKEPWHTSLAQPVRLPRNREPRWRTWQWHVMGNPPLTEEVTADRFVSEQRLPPRRAARVVPLVAVAIDEAHLGDAETIFVASFDVPPRVLVLPRRRVPYIPGTALLETTLIPEAPEATEKATWHTPFSLPTPRPRPRHFYPTQTWVPSEQFAQETPQADKFSVALSLPEVRAFLRKRWREMPFGGLDLDEADRAERIRIDAWVPMSLPRQRPRALWLPGALVLVPALTVEDVHAEALGRTDLPMQRFLRLLAQAHKENYDSELIITGNFGTPLIPRIRRYMLSAGFWRARG